MYSFVLLEVIESSLFSVAATYLKSSAQNTLFGHIPFKIEKSVAAPDFLTQMTNPNEMALNKDSQLTCSY